MGIIIDLFIGVTIVLSIYQTIFTAIKDRKFDVWPFNTALLGIGFILKGR